MTDDPSTGRRPQEARPGSSPVAPGPAGAPDGLGEPVTEPALGRTEGFLPPEPSRGSPESVLVRVVATAGIVGIGTALGAILVAAEVAGWIVGLAVALVSVVLAALLWRSRTL
jgi:hypothetical protein